MILRIPIVSMNGQDQQSLSWTFSTIHWWTRRKDLFENKEAGKGNRAKMSRDFSHNSIITFC